MGQAYAWRYSVPRCAVLSSAETFRKEAAGGVWGDTEAGEQQEVMSIMTVHTELLWGKAASSNLRGRQAPEVCLRSRQDREPVREGGLSGERPQQKKQHCGHGQSSVHLRN
jgi:hypothetical protein